MESSSDDGFQSEVTCFIDPDGRTIDVTDGYVRRRGALEKLDFYYLSDNNTMAVLGFHDALRIMRRNIKAFKRKLSAECFYKRRRKRFLNCKKELRRENNKNIANIKQHKEFKKRKNSHNENDSSTDKFSACDLGEYITQKQKWNVHPIPHENYRNISLRQEMPSTSRESYKAFSNQTLNLNSSSKNEVGNNSLVELEIDIPTLHIIKKWISHNYDFVYKYICQKDAPLDISKTDKDFYKRILISLNPVVLIEDMPINMNILDSSQKVNIGNYNNSDVQSQISKEDFAIALGLTSIKNFHNNTHSNMSQSNREDDEPVLLSSKFLPRTSTPISMGKHSRVPFLRVHRRMLSKEKDKQVSSSENWIKNKDLLLPTLNNDKTSKLPAKSKEVDNKRKQGYVSKQSIYSPNEDRIILNWVLTNDNFMKVSGNIIWKQLEKQNIMPAGKRTWQSLRSRYLKSMLYKLRDYGLSNEDEMKLKVGAEKGTLNNNKVFDPNHGVITNKNKLKITDEKKENGNRSYKHIKIDSYKELNELENKDNTENFKGNHRTEKKILNGSIHKKNNTKSSKKEYLHEKQNTIDANQILKTTRKLYTHRDFIDLE